MLLPETTKRKKKRRKRRKEKKPDKIYENMVFRRQDSK